jgi:TetR/AcrR family transcriptional regulator, regulator of mycofactocin system
MSPTTISPPPGRRRDASAAIEQAAIELFLRGRFETVTAAAIADAAGVSVRTFYRCFAAKEDILGCLPMRRAHQVAAATARRPAREAPFHAVRAAIAELAGADDPDLRRWQRAVGRARESERMSHVVVAMTAPVLTAALAERAGIPRDHVWAQVGGTAMAMAMVTGARRWAEHGGSLADEILGAVDVVGAGLRRRPEA